jgi:hypothetical protein
MLEILEAAPATDLTTIPQVVAEIGTLTPEQQDWVSLAISAASKLIEQEANQFFAQQHYRETIPGSGSTELMLARTPILGTPVIVSTDNEVIADFVVEDRDAGILYRRQGWTRDVSYLPSITHDFVSDVTHPRFAVEYDAGYWLPSFPGAMEDGQIRLPPNVEQACILTMKSWWHKKNRDATVTWKQVGNLALGYRGDAAPKGDVQMLNLPPEARILIKPRIF